MKAETMATSETEHFQQMSQSAWQQLHQAMIDLCPQHFSVADRQQLTILLIQQLSHNLQAQNLAEFWNHCQEYGEAVDTIAIELSRLPPTLEFVARLPANFFSPGAYVRWKPLPEDSDETEQLAHCHLEMTPRQFEAKWDVDRSQIAALCHCSLGNVKRWFKTDENYRSPTKYHRRYLALSNLYLEHFDRLPLELQQLICRGRSV